MNQPHYQPNFRLADDLPDSVTELQHIRILFGVVLGVCLVYRLLRLYDFPLLSIPEILWNCLVYITPSRLVCALDRSGSSTAFRQDSKFSSGSSTQHAQKSNVLRSVLGLEQMSGLQRQGKPRNPPGLGNWDNSCYQNSILQALASLQSLRAFLSDEATVLAFQQDSTAATLLDLIIRLNSGVGSYLWTPPKLKSMSSWQQQDAQEYFSKVMDAVEKDLIGANKARMPASLHSGLLEPSVVYQLQDSVCKTNTTITDCNQKFEDTPLRARDVSPTPRCLPSPLEGLLAQRVGCKKCGFTEGLSLTPFNCMTLPLGKAWKYNIEDCLDEYTTLESIDGVECAKCTLLKTKWQLSRLVEALDLVDDDKTNHDDGGPHTNSSQEDTRRRDVETRLNAVTEALDAEDFSESTLVKRCLIPSHLRTTSTKSKQVIVMRAPKVLVLHLNRSLFDETTGNQSKNYAEVKYPINLNLAQWCMGNSFRAGADEERSVTEEWEMSPSLSMIQRNSLRIQQSQFNYALRAVITHHGRHENGHYVCYRKAVRPSESSGVEHSENLQGNGSQMNEKLEKWWRFSDEDVSPVDEDSVISQGGAFMLFYERLESPPEGSYFGTPVNANVPVAHADEATARSYITPPDSIISDSHDSNIDGQEEGMQKDFFLKSSRELDANEVTSELTIEDRTPLSNHLFINNSRQPPDPKSFDLPAMRTAGPEVHRRSDDASRFRPLHVVASM